MPGTTKSIRSRRSGLRTSPPRDTLPPAQSSDDLSSTCKQLTFPTTVSATFSQASADGLERSDSQAGPTISPSGLEAAPVSRSLTAFSDGGAGRRRGFDDARHLWPNWFELIRERRPAIVFGEQVASPDGLAWFDLVSSDLESAGYAVGAADLCAAGVGAPHRRQRLYFVAVANAERGGSGARRAGFALRQGSVESDRHGTVGELDNAPGERSARGASAGREAIDRDEFAGATRGLWSPAEWIYCRDEKRRPVEPGSFPLAHGVPGRVGKLRGYGNAIVPQVAEVFIRAAMTWIAERNTP